MTLTRRVMIVAGIVILSALLAFPLRQVVYEAVVIPLSYLLWALGLFYRSLSQYIWWLAVALVILYLFIRSIITGIQLTGKQTRFVDAPKGQVQQLSEWMHKAESGMYNRWLVANRLGRLAFRLLALRESGRTRSIFEPLDGPDWNASPPLTKYLQSGLQGSFTDYPRQKNPFIPPVKTPLDLDVSDAVAFLETKIDNSIQ